MDARWLWWAMCLVIAFGVWVEAEEKNEDRTTQAEVARMPQKVFFEKLAGRWEGTCRTLSEPKRRIRRIQTGQRDAASRSRETIGEGLMASHPLQASQVSRRQSP